MELDDFKDPADPYTPRTRAEQQAARARARTAARTTLDGDALPTTQPIPLKKYLPLAIGAGIMIVLLVVMMTFQLSGGISAPGALVITPAAEETPQSSVFGGQPEQPAAEAPTAAPEQTMLDVYGAPNQQPFAQVEGDRVISPIAHYGADWIQAEVSGGAGVVWLRTADLPGIAITGPDLAPKEPPAQTGRGLGDTAPAEPAWQPPAEPAPAEEHTEPAPAPGMTISPASDPQATPTDLYQPQDRAANLEPSTVDSNPGFDASVEPGMEPTPVQ